MAWVKFLKESEIIGIVAIVLLIVGLPSFFGYVSSMSNADDIESTTDSTAEYLVDFTIGEVIGAIVLVIVGFVVAILVFLGIVKKR